MRMYQVDAFSDRLFSGNPAAVLVLEDWLPVDLMCAIAQENSLSETAFVRRRPDGNWDLRWFAPLHEVDFCGHATLATAHVLLAEHGIKGPLVFHTRAGRLEVAGEAGGYRMSLPCLPPEGLDSLPEAIAPLFEKRPVRVFQSAGNVFVDVGGADAVRDFAPDFEAIGRLGPGGLCVTGQEVPGQRAQFVSRYFAPGAGIPEDPVTGSIHATLVPYWANRLGHRRLMAFQASARGGWLDCELSADRVLLRGNAVTFMEASLRLSP